MYTKTVTNIPHHHQTLKTTSQITHIPQLYTVILKFYNQTSISEFLQWLKVKPNKNRQLLKQECIWVFFLRQHCSTNVKLCTSDQRDPFEILPYTRRLCFQTDADIYTSCLFHGPCCRCRGSYSEYNPLCQSTPFITYKLVTYYKCIWHVLYLAEIDFSRS